ncbi:hypothetical protein ACQEVB_03785 [Pseudonocardia sp. CA-107938]|uniref:hypothetical protein n=1 Tax=Pseudonocardia sp. CA-107938 TaxID=3240021 RepID=UPI003D905518
MTSPQEGGYNPYGAPQRRSTPLTPRREPARRPGLLHVAVAVLVLSAVPWLLFGAAFTFLPINVQRVIDGGTLAGSPLAGWTAEQLSTLVRGVAAGALAVALVVLVLVVFVHRRRRWARAALVAFTGVLVLTLGFLLVTSASLVFAVLLVLPVVGTALLFTGPVSAWFAGARGRM